MMKCSKLNEIIRVRCHLGSGGVPGNLSSGDNLLLPTWTLSLAVGAREDSVIGGAPVSGPSGGLASPRKLGARQV